MDAELGVMRSLPSYGYELLTAYRLHLRRGRGPEEGGVIAVRKRLRLLRTSERGATAIEYGLICALIVIGMIGVMLFV